MLSCVCTYMHESLEPTSRKKKKKRLAFHSSIFIFRDWMLMRERRKQRSEKQHPKRGKEGKQGEEEREG